VGALGAALLIGLAQPAASPARTAAQPCPPKGATVLSRSRFGVAYHKKGLAFACSRRTGKHYELGPLVSASDGGDSSCVEDVDLVHVAGPYVAWAHASLCHAPPRYHIFRRNLKTGRFLRGQSTGTSPCPAEEPACGEVGIGRASALVLTSHGSIAWIAGNDQVDEVWRYDGRGRAQLARGSDIDRAFLRRCGRVVEWRQGGSLRSASLKP
jgi:hypothetical protein